MYIVYATFNYKHMYMFRSTVHVFQQSKYRSQSVHTFTKSRRKMNELNRMTLRAKDRDTQKKHSCLVA